MNYKNKKINLALKILFHIFFVMFALISVAGPILLGNASMVNGFLGIVTETGSGAGSGSGRSSTRSGRSAFSPSHTSTDAAAASRKCHQAYRGRSAAQSAHTAAAPYRGRGDFFTIFAMG